MMISNLILIVTFALFTSCEKELLIKPDLKRNLIAIAKKNHIPTLAIRVKSENVSVNFQYKNMDKSIEPINIYGIGSTTKLLSSLLVLSYIEENKLSLDDPVYKYIDSTDFKNINWFKSITIKNLLNHTSGIQDYTHNPSWISAVIAANPPKNYTEKIALINVPDTSNHFGHFTYSNSNYVILEKIIEVISNRKAIEIFNDYYTDLGLASISFNKPINNQAFFAQEENNTSNVSDYEENYGFEGGAYATTEDLSKLLHKVFIEKTVLNASSLALMTSWTDMEKYKINYDFAQITQYGLGFMKFEFDKRTFIGHPGSSLKYQSFAFIEPETGAEIVMLTNCSGKYYNQAFLIEILKEIVKAM